MLSYNKALVEFPNADHISAFSSLLCVNGSWDGEIADIKSASPESKHVQPMTAVQEEVYEGDMNMLYLTKLVPFNFQEQVYKHLKQMS